MGQLLLVRHGQASWGAADYDVLSETGWEQSRLLGKALAARGIVPDVAVQGGMRRHRETAEACLGELSGDPEPLVDDGWDEFDHVAMLEKLRAPFEGRQPTRAEFQEWFEAATDRWTGGEYDEEYTEPFGAFTDRVGSALRRTAERAGRAPRSCSAAAARSPGRRRACSATRPSWRPRAWRKLNPVCVNSGLTRLVNGRRGTTLVSFNEHAHLDGVPDVLTYR